MAVDFLVNIRCARAGRGPHALFAEPALSKVEELCYWLLAIRWPFGMAGMHTVWTRYGKGMSPSLKPFAIKYGGMPYRGVGVGHKKSKRQAAPAEHFSATFYHPAVFIL